MPFRGMESKNVIGSSSSKRKEEENCVKHLTVEDTRQILNALSREQLIEIVQKATTHNLYVLQQVRSIAQQDTQLRKLFVWGLGPQTNKKSLSAIFFPFGELAECVVVTEKRSGKSKGYGFVTFKHINGALNALNEPSKRIDGRMTMSNFAVAGFQSWEPEADVSPRKIYVGNIPVGMEAGPLVSLFSQYGKIKEGPLGFDKQSGRSRGFALFIFKTVEAAQRALEEPIKIINNGHQIFCKIADERQMRTPTTNRVSYWNTGNRSELDQLNQADTQFDIISGEGSDNPVFGVNQGWNPLGLMPPQGWSEQNNGNHVVHGYTNHQIHQMPPMYPYSLPEYGGYGLGAYPMYPYSVPEDGGYGWSQHGEEYGFPYAVQPRSQYQNQDQGSRPQLRI